jgi:hypothetical protein
VLGRATHWLPLRLARRLAMRPLADDPSRDQPAMRTIVLGAGLVLAWYVLIGAITWHWFGLLWASVCLVTIFLAARVDFVLRDRFQRAVQRARTYFAIRADPAFRTSALAEIDALLSEAVDLERALIENAAVKR